MTVSRRPLATAEVRQPAPSGVRVRSVAVPNEHGTWGFWLEPVVLALLLAPALAGALIACAGLVAVFAQHPLSLVVADAARGRSYPRTRLARRVLAVEAPMGAALLGGGALLGGFVALVPLALAAPLACLQLTWERRNRGRDLAPELLGAVAISCLAPAIVLAGGASWQAAATCWLLLAGRNLVAVLYVRARLRVDRRALGWRAAGGLPALAAAGGFALVAGVAALTGTAPVVAAVLFAVLLSRTVLGLSRWRRPASAKAVGIGEMAFGAVAALVVGLLWAIG